MTRNPGLCTKAALTAVLGLIVGACSTGAAQESSETTSAPVALAPRSDFSLEEWGAELDTVLNEQNAGMNEVRSTYSPQLGAGPEWLDVEIEWLRAEASVLKRAFLPAHPDDDTLAPLYTGYLDGLESWLNRLEAGADGLEAEADAIKADWADGNNPRYIEISDPIFEGPGEFRKACSKLADQLVAVAPISLDCLNQALEEDEEAGLDPEPTPESSVQPAQVGDYLVSLTDAYPPPQFKPLQPGSTW